MPMQLHPFDPARDTPRPNKDGSISTEVIRTVQLPDGRWANVPSLWWSDGGAVRDFDSMDDDQLAGFAARYEQQSGSLFPRFDNLSNAETAAKARSQKGGATQGKLAGATPMPTIDYSKLLWTPFGNSPTNTFDRNNAPLPGLTSRSVQTLRVDQNGNPIMPPKPSFQAGMLGRGLSPVWENNAPGDISTAAAMNANDVVRDIPASRQSQPYIDATNPIDMFKQFGIMPSAPQNPALGAIDDLTGSGRSTASPFPLPSFRSPLYSPAMDSGNSPAPLIGTRDQAWVDQGPDMAALNAITAAGVPMPRARPNLPTMPFPQSPMVRAGRQAPVPMPSPAFRNQSATVFDRSTGSFVTGKQPPPLPKRPTAAVKKQLKAQQNGGNQSPKPAGYGSKGYSAAGRALQALYGN